MLLTNPLHNHSVSLPSSISWSPTIPCRLYNPTLGKSVAFRRLPTVVTCNISQIHSYGTVDYERRPMVKWNSVYRRISLMEKPELGSASVLNQWENEGKNLTKWELCRVVKELRKYKRYQRALEVYDWMNNRVERFRLSSSDAAIQLDLIAKVHGISSAEDYFLKLPDNLKDRRTYGALLNAYVRYKAREKAEPLLEKMRAKGYAIYALPFNVMMTLYMHLKEYDKVDLLVSEMMEKKIQLDVYSYNIWLSSCGLQGFEEKMEQVFEQMKEDKTIVANWTTFSTLATMYIKMGKKEKAEDCLRRVESRITGRYRIPYHYLVSLYGSAGNKDETHRVWNLYKSIFPTIPNLGYSSAVSSFLKLGDIDSAEKVYEEWLSVNSSFDPRISNLLIGWYVKKGSFEKAKGIFDHMVEVGGKPNAKSWESLVEGHVRDKRISKALLCWKEAFSEGSWGWKPRPVNVLSFFQLCEEDDDVGSKQVLEELLSQSGYLQDETYASLVGLSSHETGKNRAHGENNIDENEDDEMLFNDDFQDHLGCISKPEHRARDLQTSNLSDRLKQTAPQSTPVGGILTGVCSVSNWIHIDGWIPAHVFSLDEAGNKL